MLGEGGKAISRASGIINRKKIVTIAEKIVEVASRLGEPEEVLASALKKEILAKLVEMEAVVRAMERKYGMTLKEFEERGMLDELGHSWEVEQDYYEWDRAETELENLRELLRRLEE